MRIGIFGGSFDPVHNAHRAVARACQQQAALDEVWFTPTATQPLKQSGPHASDHERVEMLQLAIGDEPAWRVCTLEVERGGLSYTVDTLRQIHTELPDEELFFIMGSDVLADVPHWKEPAEIFRLSTPLVIARAGQPPPDLSVLAPFCARDETPCVIEMQPFNISSSEIRRRIQSGESIDHLVPLAVVDFIFARGLYH
jgi:nicotinate-nucleotide adenylyltransferase